MQPTIPMLRPTSSRGLLGPVLLCLSPALAAQLPDGWQEPGVFGTTYPQPADVLLDDVRVHLDTTGGAEQILLDLAASDDGFAAVWRDTRFGSLGLVLDLLDADGARLDLEVPVSNQHTARQFEPAVAVGGDLVGAVAWFGSTFQGQSTMLRPFDGAGGFVVVPIPVEGAVGGHGRDARGRGSSGSTRPGVGVDAAGGGIVVWPDGDQLRAQRYVRGAPKPGGGFEVERDGEAFALVSVGGKPTGSPVVGLRPGGETLVAWPTSDGTALWSDAGGGGRTRSTPLTDVERIVAERGGEGWWIAARRRDRPVLARVTPSLKAEVVVQFADDVLRVDVAPAAEGVAVAVERPVGASGARFELRWFTPLGAPLGAPRPFGADGGAAARGVRLASSGAAVVAAWTDAREGDDDVWYRVFDADPEAAADDAVDRRWNTDRASSDQSDAALDVAGDAGWIAWEDRRSGATQIRARRLGPGGPTGDDLALSVGDGDARSPAVAARADGAALAVWKAGPPRERRLMARFLDAREGPRGEPFALDPDALTGGDWPAAVATLADGGFAVLFTRDGDRLALARVGADGVPDGKPREIARERGADLRYPDLTVLDDGRLLALWDVSRAGRPAALAGRFLHAALKPDGGELSFEPSPEGKGDWDPAAAPGPDGGFLMAWTGNDGPARDVFARAYDARGRAAGPPLAISVRATEQDFPEVERLPDGSWAVVWEDDISNYDHVLVRRVRPDFTLGPRATFNQRETDFVEARSSPTTAVLGGGLVGAWTDRRRSQGLDVYLRIIGPAFDDFKAPPPRDGARR